ncbi:hypothetical protein DFH08DRAFT_977254 [Mycena albidolilacea]|uniref:Zn(2)-C6 fungal-type domain-containing protein n=1 Tax=Mycena albidolilacea TaxID=1033008 RepID=A0AAD6Z0T0_9AGAR|nr:hypothetical protein DFH08DRAFT_977254 [Mycena albidolilacea]
MSQHSHQSQQSGATCISRESSVDSVQEHAARLMEEIEELRQGIIGGMSLEAVERACVEPEFLQYLQDLIELEGEAETEVATAAANLRTAQDDVVEATNRCDQIVELRQRFEWSNLQPTEYVDAVNLLRRAVSPDAEDVSDAKLDSGDESGDGEASEETAEVGEKRKGKGKAKVSPKKARMDREEESKERDGSLRACDKCTSCRVPCVVLPGKTACDGCHKLHVKCSLRPQSTKRVLQKKVSRVAEALAKLGRRGAEEPRPESQASSRRRQVDSRTGEIIPDKISPFEEMRHGLLNTQRRLRELEQREEERERKKKRRRENRAAGNQPERDGEPQAVEGSSERAGRSASRSAKPLSRPVRSRSRTGVALLDPVVPVVSPVDDTSLIRMTVKVEHEEANNAAMAEIKKRGEERAARKAERRERIAREEAEKKERERAAIDAELQALMAKKAALENSQKPKPEPVEETIESSSSDVFQVPTGFHIEGDYLVLDDWWRTLNK